MCARPRRRRIAAFIGVLIAAYVVSYVVLSIRGRFEPVAIGLNGVKGYRWAPEGFYADMKWRLKPAYFYLPLYCMDTGFWHSPYAADADRYPITEVDPKDIWKYYEAWGVLDE